MSFWTDCFGLPSFDYFPLWIATPYGFRLGLGSCLLAEPPQLKLRQNFTSQILYYGVSYNDVNLLKVEIVGMNVSTHAAPSPAHGIGTFGHSNGAPTS
ncbi:hypothetical protein GQ457_07G007600 [Hibiscus cannabinus]